MLTFISKNVLSEDEVKLIMNRFDRNEKHLDSLGRAVYNFHTEENAKDRDYIMDKIDPFFPNNPSFNYVLYGHIAEHQQGAFLPYNVDLFDNVTGMGIVFLSENVSGGRLIVNDTIVSPTLGTIVCFQEPSIQQFMIETIYDNTKSPLHYIICAFTDEEPVFAEDDEPEQEMSSEEEFEVATVNV